MVATALHPVPFCSRAKSALLPNICSIFPDLHRTSGDFMHRAVGRIIFLQANNILVPRGLVSSVAYLTETVFFQVRLRHRHAGLCPVNRIYDTGQ